MGVNRSNQSALLLCAMILLTPALGFPNEELLQDTLKSILVSFFALSAAMVYFWDLRRQKEEVRFHVVLLAPFLLMAYALGSMAWSHTYLAGVETIRWFLFSLIFFLGLNTFSQIRITHLAWSVHIGAVVASLWTALQFWFDFGFFAQGPNPASTFVNRNFFGEFVVCSLPFSVLLVTRVRDKTTAFFLTFTVGFNVVALMQTGTRSALVSFLVLTILLPIIVYRYRRQVLSVGWRLSHCAAITSVFIATIFFLGSIPTNNVKLIHETGQGNGIDRAFKRTLSMTQATEYSEGSFSVRAAMWRATGRMIRSNPLTGVGAGAWEVHIPLYQESGSQLEPDYYAHNEILQMLAEYGLIGWLFLTIIFTYLMWAAYVTWVNTTEKGLQEALPRALTLSSLLVLLLVSNAGFPWRLAATGALFALSLAILAASDLRLGHAMPLASRVLKWSPRASSLALVATGILSALAIFIAQQAIECESKIVRAIKIALTISQSGKATDPRWGDLKAEMLQLIREGIAINPHYRKLTPTVADAMANWGDWKNASWIWGSVSESRPNVVALLANVARAEIQIGNFPKAELNLHRAIHIQPDSISLKTLEMLLWVQTGREREAGIRAKELLHAQGITQDLVRTAYYLGMRNRDAALAIEAMKVRITTWPEQAMDGWLKLGNIYASPELHNDEMAIKSYRAALDATEPQYKDSMRALIPRRFHAELP